MPENLDNFVLEHLRDYFAGRSGGMDRVENRLERIEHRLDLRDAQRRQVKEKGRLKKAAFRPEFDAQIE